MTKKSEKLLGLARKVFVRNPSDKLFPIECVGPSFLERLGDCPVVEKPVRFQTEILPDDMSGSEILRVFRPAVVTLGEFVYDLKHNKDDYRFVQNLVFIGNSLVDVILSDSGWFFHADPIEDRKKWLSGSAVHSRRFDKKK